MSRFFKNVFAWIVSHAKTFDLLPDYFRAIRERWIEIFWGASLPFFAFVIWWSFVNPPTLVTAGAVIWAFLVAGYYAWRTERLKMLPGIALHFENRPPFVQMIPRIDGQAGLKVYVRLFPECSQTLTDCTGYLLSICRRDGDRWEPTYFNEPVPLIWEGRGTVPTTVEPLIGPYLNVFYIGNEAKQIVPCIAQNAPARMTTPRNNMMFSNRNECFRFAVKVTNSEPIYLKVQLGDQTWERPLVDILPNENSN
jgi:hypothetical protein